MFKKGDIVYYLSNYDGNRYLEDYEERIKIYGKFVEYKKTEVWCCMWSRNLQEVLDYTNTDETRGWMEKCDCFKHYISPTYYFFIEE